MKYINLAFIVLLMFSVFSCSGNKDNESKGSIKIITVTHALDSTAWIFDKIVGQTAYFKFNKKFTTNLYDLKYIGQLQTKYKAPYLILSGRGCNECDANISIYIHSPSDGPMKSEAEQTRYGYPGKEVDYADNSLIFESRVFFGDCLNKNNTVIWLQKIRAEKGKFKSSIFSIEVVGDKLKETFKIIDSLTFKNYIPKCKELPGVNATSAP